VRFIVVHRAVIIATVLRAFLSLLKCVDRHLVVADAIVLHVVEAWLVVEMLTESGDCPVVDGLTRRRALMATRRHTLESRLYAAQRLARRRHRTQGAATVGLCHSLELT